MSRDPNRRSDLTLVFVKGVSDAKVKFLDNNQALTVQVINNLRDAAQHHILDISEPHIYIQAQAGLSLFRNVVKSVFGEEVQAYLPIRALPLSTNPPVDLAALFDMEATEIKKLLSPKTRKRTEAEAKLRSLAIVENSLSGKKTQPTIGELRRLASEIGSGKKRWSEIFPGVASVTLTAEGHVAVRVAPVQASCAGRWPDLLLARPGRE